MSKLPVVIDNTKLVEVVSDFNAPMSQYLIQLNLPVEDVLYPIEERQKVFMSFQSAISDLPIEQLEKATYLTKFAASIAAGLFDGALTYLWNETVKSIRRMVIEFDLVHFYSIASEVNSRYKNLRDEDQLEEINEYDLITICNRIGLLDNHVYEIFKHINYMRNHSSAAHPTEHQIGAFDILSWLDNCIKYAINAKPNKSSIQVKRLLYHLRNEEIPEDDYEVIGSEIQRLPSKMIDDLLTTLFGMYTDSKIKEEVINNIKGIAPYVWDASSDDKKYEIGEKFGYFRKNGDVGRKNLANDFLKLVDGLGYKDEDSLAAEIREVLNNLLSTHYSYNNFYNEYPWAKQLKELIPNNGIIPKTVEKEWVRIITICYCGNGLGYRQGVDEGAESYYKEFISNFTEKNVFQLLNMLDNQELLGDMEMPKVRRRFKRLCKDLIENVDNVFLEKALDFIIDFQPALSKVHKDTKFQSMLKKVIL